MKDIIRYLQSEETKERIIALVSDNMLLYQGINTEVQLQKYTGVLYNLFVKECVQDNQYISLSNKTINSINDIYRQLISNLRLLSYKNCEPGALRETVEAHRRRLLAAVHDNEYEDADDQLIIPCAEYTAELQNNLLRTDIHPLQEPIIDIGCGISYELIKFLRKKGYSEVYGIDQYVSGDSGIVCSNWFDYQFQENTWGTITAHMSFSNHVRRSLINRDENREKYIQKYTEILHSLKPHGVFIYTPSLRELETELCKTDYEVRYYQNTDDRNLDTVHITKE